MLLNDYIHLQIMEIKYGMREHDSYSEYNSDSAKNCATHYLNYANQIVIRLESLIKCADIQDHISEKNRIDINYWSDCIYDLRYPAQKKGA